MDSLKNNKGFKESKVFLYILAFLCSIFWGMSFIGTSTALRSLEPIQILSLRWTISTLLFVLLSLTKVIKVNFKGKKLRYGIIIGLLQPCAYAIFEVYGLSFTTASESSIFIATIPLIVLLIERIFLRVKHPTIVNIAILIAILGVCICFGFSPTFSIGGKGLGYLCLFMAIVAGALQCIATSKFAGEFNAIETTFIMSICGAVFFNLLNFPLGYGLDGYVKIFTDTSLLISILFLGVFCSCMCYVIFAYALAKLNAAVASNLITNSTTAVGVIAGVIILNDSYGWYTIFGLTLVFVGILLSGKNEKVS